MKYKINKIYLLVTLNCIVTPVLTFVTLGLSVVPLFLCFLLTLTQLQIEHGDCGLFQISNSSIFLLFLCLCHQRHRLRSYCSTLLYSFHCNQPKTVGVSLTQMHSYSLS
jgi:hypothetical protein